MSDCYCGTSRAAVEAQARRERLENAPAQQLLALLLGLVAVAVVCYPALVPDGAPPAPQPSAPEMQSVDSEPGTPTVATRSPYIPDRQEVGGAMAPQPSPVRSDIPPPVSAPVPAGTPGPTPSVDPERTEVDLTRDAGEKRLEQTLAGLQTEMTRLSANAREFESVCQSPRGNPGSCQRLFEEIASGGESLERGLEQVENDARRSWVSPGAVRDLRRRHGLEESACSDLVSAVHRLAAQRRGAS